MRDPSTITNSEASFLRIWTSQHSKESISGHSWLSIPSRGSSSKRNLRLSVRASRMLFSHKDQNLTIPGPLATIHRSSCPCKIRFSIYKVSSDLSKKSSAPKSKTWSRETKSWKKSWSSTRRTTKSSHRSPENSSRNKSVRMRRFKNNCIRFSLSSKRSIWTETKCN